MGENIEKVFFNMDQSILKCACADVVDAEDIEYASVGNRLNGRIAYYLTHPRVLSKLPLRVQALIFSKLLGYKFLKLKRPAPILFIFMDGYEMFSNPQQLLAFLDFLHRWFKKAKFALYRYETVNDSNKAYFPQICQRFDLRLSFSRFDAEWFDELEYYGGICEHDLVPFDPEVEECDLFYAGTPGFKKDTGRLDMIINIFKTMSEQGKKCIFYLTHLTEDDKLKLLNIGNINRGGGILYHNSKLYMEYCCYSKTVAHIKKAKAMLEIVLPQGLASCTMRMPQALAYGVKLITNCRSVFDEPFYDETNIQYFNKPSDIDIRFFDTPTRPISYNFSAMAMVRHIEQRLYNDIR